MLFRSFPSHDMGFRHSGNKSYSRTGALSGALVILAGYTSWRSVFAYVIAKPLEKSLYSFRVIRYHGAIAKKTTL